MGAYNKIVPKPVTPIMLEGTPDRIGTLIHCMDVDNPIKRTHTILFREFDVEKTIHKEERLSVEDIDSKWKKITLEKARIFAHKQMLSKDQLNQIELWESYKKDYLPVTRKY